MGTFQLRNVHKAFGATNIIPNLDLDIEDGEFVVFVSPSGCGKSTLLRVQPHVRPQVLRMSGFV